MKEQLEKWKEMLKTGGKNRWAVFLLAGLLLLVISLPTGEEKRAPVLQTEAADEKSVSQAEELAERLEKVLSRVSGVGKTKVLVTLKSDGKRLVEKDSTTREDSSESRDQEENTVYEKNGTVCLARYDMVASQIHVADGGGEDDVYRLGKGHFHAIGRNHLAVWEFPGNPPVQVVASRILHGVSGLCVCRIHAQQEGEHYKNLFHR